MMKTSGMSTYSRGISRFFCFSLAILMAIFVLAAPPSQALASDEQKSFPSPQQAVTGLIEAIEGGNDIELLSILGPTSGDIIFSGDNVADQKGKAHFLKAYKMKSSLELESDGQATLLIGDKNYPFPIPIIRQGNTWVFDTQAGREEILNRRIGRNELHTIEVMHAYVDAQREYACMIRDNNVPTFAQKLSSSEGKKDGLYWESNADEMESPFGPLVAMASKKGYATGLNDDKPVPFRGYHFKILKGQGKHANGGAFDYVIDGKMILGFALVAYPAKYGASGIMTFIVNQEDQIYEKDLGEQTEVNASVMTIFDPDDTWGRYKNPAAP